MNGDPRFKKFPLIPFESEQELLDYREEYERRREDFEGDEPDEKKLSEYPLATLKEIC